MSEILNEATKVVNKFNELKSTGAKVVQKALYSDVDVHSDIAMFSEEYDEWIADGGMEEAGHISYYPKTGMAYMCGVNSYRQQGYEPDVATNNYNPYPQADENGIFPYVYGMTVWNGMKVRDKDVVYNCIIPSGTYKLIYEPSQVPSIFEVWEG